LLHEDTSYRKVVLCLFPRAVKAFHAIRLLCDEGYGEDGLVLARSLINIAIDLGFISAEDREKCATRWFFYYAIVALDEVTRHPVPDDLSDVARLSELRDEIVRRDPQVSKTFRRGWSGKTIAERAEKSGLDHKYWYKYIYWELSAVEHSDVFGTTSLVRSSGKGWERYITPHSPAWVYTKAMEVALEMFSHVTDLTLRAFDLPEVQDLPSVQERSRQLYAEAETEMIKG